MTTQEYIMQRVLVLDKLISEQEPKSQHYYALMAGKFELLLLSSSLTL